MGKEEWRPGGDELVLVMNGMDEKKSPPVLIKDRTVVGSVDQV